MGFHRSRSTVVHPKVPRLVVSEVPEEHRVGEVEVLPWARFLDRLDDWM